MERLNLYTIRNNMSIYSLIDEEKHLPDILKDFHDQKDVMKSMYNFFNKTETNKMKCSSTDLHIDIVDHFLQFMFIHGYKLQRTRIKCDNDYCDMSETIEARRNKEAELLKSFIAKKLK